VGTTIKAVNAQDDSNVFGKAGTSGAEFQKAMVGRKIVGAGQQGKYFWLETILVCSCASTDWRRMVMDSPPHPVMHFGMTGSYRPLCIGVLD
jgi:formamidopyrimidine-DNA glycosylase